MAWAGTCASRIGTLHDARLDRNEVAGALGDLGTFLPLLVGMSAQNGLDFGAALFFAGVFNVVTGLTFSIPMAVQPMKAIAAVAITGGLNVHEILAAGVIVSAIVLVLGLTNLLDVIQRVVPKSVVRGIQLGLGLSLVTKGIAMVVGTKAMFAPDGYLTGALALVAVLALTSSKKMPAALVLFAAGLGLAAWKSPGVVSHLSLGLHLPRFTPLAFEDFGHAFFKAALPQIPLTTLNSVVAVSALSSDLFPGRPASPKRIAISVGLMNLTAAWFGGMPMCHGAGGLAGQHRFGARTNGSILFLGAMKMAIALLFGASMMSLCGAFPASVLGVMLATSGVELALVTRDQTERIDALTMLATAGACLAIDVAVGFVVGIAITAIFRLVALVQKAD